MQEYSNSLMVEVCRQEYVSLEKAFLQLFYHVLQKSRQYDFLCVEKTAYKNLRSWCKKKQNF